MPANRIAAIAAFITGILGALAGIESWGGLPKGVASVIVTVTGILGAILTVLHFMSGAQKSEALAASRAPIPPATPVLGTSSSSSNVATPSGFVTVPVPPAPTPVVPAKPSPVAAVVVKPLPKAASKATTPTAVVKPAPKVK
jgi:hypothetical protein